MIIQGQGVRERQLRGSIALDDAPKERLLSLRRFECQECKAVLVVGPPELLRYQQFSVTSLILALFGWSIEQKSPQAMRGAVGTWNIVGVCATEGWQSLRRWAAHVVSGRFWARAQAPPGDSLRKRTARALSLLDLSGGLEVTLAGVQRGALHVER